MRAVAGQLFFLCYLLAVTVLALSLMAFALGDILVCMCVIDSDV